MTGHQQRVNYSADGIAHGMFGVPITFLGGARRRAVLNLAEAIVGPDVTRLAEPDRDADRWTAARGDDDTITATSPAGDATRRWPGLPTYDELHKEWTHHERAAAAARAACTLLVHEAAERVTTQQGDDVRVEAMCRAAHGERAWEQAAPEFRSEHRAAMHRAMLAGLAEAAR